MTKTATLTVTKLLTEDEYIVPLYQRNFHGHMMRLSNCLLTSQMPTRNVKTS